MAVRVEQSSNLENRVEWDPVGRELGAESVLVLAAIERKADEGSPVPAAPEYFIRGEVPVDTDAMIDRVAALGLEVGDRVTYEVVPNALTQLLDPGDLDLGTFQLVTIRYFTWNVTYPENDPTRPDTWAATRELPILMLGNSYDDQGQLLYLNDVVRDKGQLIVNPQGVLPSTEYIFDLRRLWLPDHYTWQRSTVYDLRARAFQQWAFGDGGSLAGQANQSAWYLEYRWGADVPQGRDMTIAVVDADTLVPLPGSNLSIDLALFPDIVSQTTRIISIVNDIPAPGTEVRFAFTYPTDELPGSGTETFYGERFQWDNTLNGAQTGPVTQQGPVAWEDL